MLEYFSKKTTQVNEIFLVIFGIYKIRKNLLSIVL